MIDTLTIAHLSDLHLGPVAGFHPRFWNAKRGLGYINYQRGRREHHLMRVAEAIAADAIGQCPDHIVVTGDLVNLGLPSEFEVAYAYVASLGPPDRVSVIPGNHDIYTSTAHGKLFLARFAEYMTSNDGLAANGGSGEFPFVRLVGPVALIGLNSAVPTPPFVAAGRLGPAQLAALGATLERLGDGGYVRVVLIHHPPLQGLAPPRRALEDAADLEQVLDQYGAELVLHGHNHTDTLSWRQRGERAVPVVGVASGSSGRLHKLEPLARYNLIRFSREEGRTKMSCTARGLGAPDGIVVELKRTELSQATGTLVT